MKKKEKLNFYRAMLIALSLSISNPNTVLASEKKPKEPTYPDWFNFLIEYSEKAEDLINEHVIDPINNKTNDLREYDIEDLYIVTDLPNEDPEIMRHYYFMSNNSIPVKWTYYYNNQKEKVKQNDNPRYKELRKMYISITNPEVVFRTEEWTDLKTNKVTLNYETWDEDRIIYDEDTTARYIKYNNIEQFLSESDLNRVALTKKLSVSDLIRIEEYINDPSYNLDYENINIDEYKDAKKLTKAKK